MVCPTTRAARLPPSLLAAALLLLALPGCTVDAQEPGACPEGFTGAGCVLCQSHDACAARTGHPDAMCSSTLAFDGRTRTKFYNGTVAPASAFYELLDPASLVLQCSTALVAGQALPSRDDGIIGWQWRRRRRGLAQAEAASLAGPSCSLAFALASQPVRVECVAVGCTFITGQPSFTCATSFCSCPDDDACGGTPEVGALVSGMSGQFNLTCSEAGECHLRFGGLLDSFIDAALGARECLLPEDMMGSSSTACAEGWEGSQCAVCASDAACAARYGQDTRCSWSPVFEGTSFFKSYSCQLGGDTAAEQLLGLRSVLVQCSTGLVAAGVPAAAPGCALYFAGASAQVELFCAAVGCLFVAGESTLQCSTTLCMCPPGSSCDGDEVIADLVRRANGRPFSLDCSAAGSCSIVVEGLPGSTTEATCRASECVGPPPPPPPPSSPAPPWPPAPPYAPEPGLAPEVAPGQQPAPPGEPAPSSPPPSPAAEQPPSPPPKKTGIPCPTGWGGNQCAICQSDAACTGQEGGGTGDTGATCSASLTYAPASRLKSLSCDLAQGSPLADLVEPGTLLVQCRTGAPGGGAAAPAGAAAAAVGAPQAGPGQGGAAAALDYASADAATRRRRRHRRRLLLLEPAGGRMCDVSFFTSSPRVMVQCAATDCTMEAGSAAVTCAAVACTCPDTPGCSSFAIEGLIQPVAGPFELSCDEAGRCSMALGGLPEPQLDAVCSAGECLVEGETNLPQQAGY
ncbi:hypothetical protein CHLNCDRAFT_144324 [Chlorella variabilis]|uniref:Uncharacterized protein n=1 Tax=Chlorella variabilis TaxID=554065 RepID=E1ZCE8_CHLVA|nr:hypothetical protein CHLNCDRAFT_144324 [Chlorella variabilis]EFN56804.1 hypothetical protein CHLNCDRAFT_144324 [Chlorella variabilis]|eukprot:XP_005848906.1 hypothetical protein CHLNCDRAFT_144324 [Chlorella variabilis]